ncbi:XkdX family protein [Metabacillus fastidiosus]|nr:XkdX family protein [Metabacillus fastidiosus]
MDWFACIKRYYPKYWTKSMVGDAVVCGKITEEQYEEIIGEAYTV